MILRSSCPARRRPGVVDHASAVPTRPSRLSPALARASPALARASPALARASPALARASPALARASPALARASLASEPVPVGVCASARLPSA
ncbi:hypothetical protein [Micromonospora rifamycinica]|uniref:Uncharacterized protein n=1 Tax=Micromonospora rifamycinica TaxID=291594 RepID=A0A1C5KDN8_9ACTN|nr:hypothetical protein [Micromonospora rifamycinica]SCG80985.1 hypothetical protein GA0070623_5355 [Micromonospora rifamycinica]